MANEESLREVAHSPAPFSAWLGIVVLFALFGVIVLAIIGPSPRSDSYEQTRAKKRAENLKTLRDEDAKTLTAYAWIDKNKGVARIPIERAMQITVAELAKKKPAPAGPIATPAPEAPATAGSPSPSVAPSASPQATGTPKATSVAGPESENRGQPAAATHPPPAKPATQPGPSATPAASPGSSARPVASPAAGGASPPAPAKSGGSPPSAKPTESPSAAKPAGSPPSAKPAPSAQPGASPGGPAKPTASPSGSESSDSIQTS